MNKTTKLCQCCGAGFVSGKDYGDYWTDAGPKDGVKGLCEFCNPNNEKWYIKEKSCHNG